MLVDLYSLLLCQMNKPASTLFALFLMEDEDGNVTARSDFVGEGKNAFDLGMEIMGNLYFLESMNRKHLRVEKCLLSSYHN